MNDVHEHPVWVYGPMLLITENTFPEQLLVGQQAIRHINTNIKHSVIFPSNQLSSQPWKA